MIIEPVRGPLIPGFAAVKAAAKAAGDASLLQSLTNALYAVSALAVPLHDAEGVKISLALCHPLDCRTQYDMIHVRSKSKINTSLQTANMLVMHALAMPTPVVKAQTNLCNLVYANTITKYTL